MKLINYETLNNTKPNYLTKEYIYIYIYIYI